MTPVHRDDATLADLIEDAAHSLAMTGWLDPDAEQYPAEVIAELAGIARNPCGSCAHGDGLVRLPREIAEHWIQRRQEAWERTLPAWTCDCGRVYKVTPREFGGGQTYYHAREDGGLLGDPAGGVRTDVKGKVKHSDACACGADFAQTAARQDSPQGYLF